jgi:hypothetical protein
MIRNNGEDNEVHVDELGGTQDQKGQPNRVRGPTHFEFDAVSEPKTSTR